MPARFNLQESESLKPMTVMGTVLVHATNIKVLKSKGGKEDICDIRIFGDK